MNSHKVLLTLPTVKPVAPAEPIFRSYPSRALTENNLNKEPVSISVENGSDSVQTGKLKLVFSVGLVMFGLAMLTFNKTSAGTEHIANRHHFMHTGIYQTDIIVRQQEPQKKFSK